MNGLRVCYENKKLSSELLIYSRNCHEFFLFQKKINNFEIDYNSLDKRHNDLNGEHERLRDHVRKVEQLNDDLERTNRVVSATVSDLEAMLTEAYEKNQLLESEVEDKETLTEKHQRVLDELRGVYFLLISRFI